MKTVITAKLKLKTMPEQFARLRQTQLAYRDAHQLKKKLVKALYGIEVVEA